LPGFGRVGAKEAADSLGIEFIFVPKMPVEAPSRETGILHDFINRDIGKSPFVEPAPGAFEDFIAGVALVLQRIGHGFLLAKVTAIPAKDVLEHLLPIGLREVETFLPMVRTSVSQPEKCSISSA
jgi:hypothetical protein